MFGVQRSGIVVLEDAGEVDFVFGKQVLLAAIGGFLFFPDDGF